MSMHAKVSGAWKTVATPSVKVGGAWKTTDVWANVSGTWKLVHPTPVEIGSTTTFNSGTDASSYTATGLAVIAADERALIAVSGRGAATRTINSVTVGGAAATQLHKADNSGTTIALYIAPLGATGDVVINLSGTWLRAYAAVWPTKNIKGSAASAVSDSTAAPPSCSVAVPAGGAAFAAAFNNTSDVPTITGDLTANQFNTTAESARMTGRAKPMNNTLPPTTMATTFDYATEANQAMVMVSLR